LKTNTQQLTKYLEQYISPQRQQKIEQILNTRTKHLTIILENIYHSPNASAVIRTAECFGLQDLYTIENTYQLKINTRVVRGSAKWLNIHRYNKPPTNNITHCIKKLKKQGYNIIATSLTNDAIPLQKIDITQKNAIIFGTEENGISNDAKQQADQIMQIPMQGFTQSLNISVSAAICIQYLSQKIRASKQQWQLSTNEKEQLKLQWYKKSIKHIKQLIQYFESNNKNIEI